MSDKKVEHLTLFELLERDDLFDLGLPEEETNEYQKFIRSIETAKKQAANEASHNDNVNNYVLFRTIFYDDSAVIPKDLGNNYNRNILKHVVYEHVKATKLPEECKKGIEFVDVIPLGVLVNFVDNMTASYILKSKEKLTFTNACVLWSHTIDRDGKLHWNQEEELTIKFVPAKYATMDEDACLSLTIVNPLVLYRLKGKLVIKPAPLDMLHACADMYGKWRKREGVTMRDQYDDNSNNNKNRITFYYDDPPRIDLPPFQAVPDTNGKPIGAWITKVNCYKPAIYNVCSKCKEDVSGLDEGSEHQCLDFGNLLPTMKRTRERAKYHTKIKNLKEEIAEVFPEAKPPAKHERKTVSKLKAYMAKLAKEEEDKFRSTRTGSGKKKMHQHAATEPTTPGRNEKKKEEELTPIQKLSKKLPDIDQNTLARIAGEVINVLGEKRPASGDEDSDDEQPPRKSPANMFETLQEESLDANVLTDLTQGAEETVDTQQLAIDLLTNAVATIAQAPESEHTI